MAAEGEPKHLVAWLEGVQACWDGDWAALHAYLLSDQATPEMVTAHKGTPTDCGDTMKVYEGPLLAWTIWGAGENGGRAGSEHARCLTELIQSGKVTDPNVLMVRPGDKWSVPPLYIACWCDSAERAERTYPHLVALLAANAAGHFATKLDTGKRYTLPSTGEPGWTSLVRAAFWGEHGYEHLQLLAAYPDVDLMAANAVRCLLSFSDDGVCARQS